MPEDPSAAWRLRHQRWLRYVRNAAAAMEAGSRIPTGPSPKALTAPRISKTRGRQVKVVICAPHPDDESLVGALPLRLRLECQARVTNCAITLGSNVGQRARRLAELESACRVLGFELVVPHYPSGFERVNLENRQAHPEQWSAKVQSLVEIFNREKPDVIFAPHAEDFNTSHIGTHFLVVDALGAYLEKAGRSLFPLIEAEFWHQNARPNLMVGISADVEAVLLMAAAEHGGEMSRNPYHLRHLGRMMDNVRLGSEVVGGQGGRAYAFAFAELYRVTFMQGREVIAPRPGGRVIGPMERINFASLVREFYPAAQDA